MSEERNDFAMSVARSAGTRGKKTNSREGETAKNDQTGMYGPGENVVQSDANRKARLEIDL